MELTVYASQPTEYPNSRLATASVTKRLFHRRAIVAVCGPMTKQRAARRLKAPELVFERLMRKPMRRAAVAKGIPQQAY